MAFMTDRSYSVIFCGPSFQKISCYGDIMWNLILYCEDQPGIDLECLIA